jgi:hypothetical protein
MEVGAARRFLATAAPRAVFTRLRYDTTAFPFAELVRRYLDVDDLHQLHVSHPLPALDEHTEQHTELHRRLYAIGDDFHQLYRRFVANWVVPTLGEDVKFQSTPNFRFQMPGSRAVSSWHRDTDNGHGVDEINFWVPLTTVTEHNCVWIESDAGESIPMPAAVGEVLVFDGANRPHGNRVNSGDTTRVSFEFRIIPAARYTANDNRSTVMGKRFVDGDYFTSFEPPEN